jgi:hypothetical protein
MLRHEAIDDVDLECFLEHGISLLEDFNGILLGFDWVDLGPLNV